MRKHKQLGKLAKYALQYQSFQINRPVIETSTRMAICTLVGDLSAQLALERRPINLIDWKRTLRLTGIGILVMGPMFGGGRMLMSRILKAKPTDTYFDAIKEIVVGSLTIVPPTIGTVIGVIGWRQNLKWDQIKSKVKDEIRYVVPFAWLIQGVVATIPFVSAIVFPITLKTYFAILFVADASFATFLSDVSNKDVQIEDS